MPVLFTTTPRSKVQIALPAAFAVGSLGLAGQAFLTVPATTRDSAVAAFRGGPARAAVQQAAAQPNLPSFSVGIAGLSALAGVMASASRASRPSARAAVEEDKPLPPAVEEAIRAGRIKRPQGRAGAAAAFMPSKQVGVTSPLGFFDPLGFSKKGDKAGFRKLRAAEIKHGRVAMLAAVGALAQHFVKLPGFEQVPAGLRAVTTEPGTYGFAALVLLAGVLELGLWTENDAKEPGDFGDPLNLGQYNTDMRNREINNGRMAMVSAFGIVVAELATGKDGVQQLGF